MSQYFNGSTHRIQNAAALLSLSTFTMGGFLKLDNHSDGLEHTIISISRNSGGGSDDGFYLTYFGQLYGVIFATGQSNIGAIGGTISDENWHFVAFVASSGSSRYVRLDDAAGATETTSRTLSGLTVTNIGAYQNISGSYFNNVGHRLAGLFGYDIALTSGELDQLQKGDCPLSVRPDHLVLAPSLIAAADDWKGNSWTATGATVSADHPGLRYLTSPARRAGPIIMPRRRFFYPRGLAV